MQGCVQLNVLFLIAAVVMIGKNVKGVSVKLSLPLGSPPVPPDFDMLNISFEGAFYSAKMQPGLALALVVLVQKY